MAEDISDEPIVLGRDLTETQGDVTMLLRRQYLPPMDGTDDELKRFDTWIAKRVAELLVKKYFGYMWHVTADSKQGIVYFSIPELMGPTLKYVIRLGDYADLTPKLITGCAGELLERMNLPRGRANMARLAEARQRRHTFQFEDVKS